MKLGEILAAKDGAVFRKLVSTIDEKVQIEKERVLTKIVFTQPICSISLFSKPSKKLAIRFYMHCPELRFLPTEIIPPMHVLLYGRKPLYVTTLEPITKPLQLRLATIFKTPYCEFSKIVTHPKYNVQFFKPVMSIVFEHLDKDNII